MNDRLLSALFGVVLIFSAHISPLEAQESPEFELFPWQEAVASVVSFDRYEVFFEEIAEWELRSQGEVSREQLTAWGLPKAATATYRVYANKNATQGFIRLLEFDGVEQRFIRQDSQPWDTGGIFDINMRVRNLEEVAQKLRLIGWKSRSAPQHFNFGTENVEVLDWIVSSPDGIELCLLERVSPPVTDWPNFKAISRAFNATQVVKDFDRTLSFYTDVLGYEPDVLLPGYLAEAGPNSLGLPFNLQAVNPRQITIMELPGHKQVGTIELVTILGLDGADHSEHAKLPNYGLGALRFPVKNIDAFEKHLKRFEIEWVHPLQLFDSKRSLTIRAPEGAWMEFFEEL